MSNRSRYFATSLSAAPRRDSVSKSTGERFSAQFDISDACGLRGLRLSFERLRPGARIAPPHAHSAREEGFLLLSGEVTARIGDEQLPMKPGDLVVVHPGSDVAHTVVNRGEQDADLFVFSNEPLEDRVHYFPA